MNFLSQEGHTNDILTMSLFVFLNLVCFGQQEVLSKIFKKLFFLKEKIVAALFLIYVLILVLTLHSFGKTSDHFYELYMHPYNIVIFGSIVLFPIVYKTVFNILYEFSMENIIKFLKNKKTFLVSQIGKEEK